MVMVTSLHLKYGSVQTLCLVRPLLQLTARINKLVGAVAVLRDGAWGRL